MRAHPSTTAPGAGKPDVGLPSESRRSPGGGGYEATRSRVETYFDRTAAGTWAQLTSDAPVSRIRATVRAGRDRMRATILSRLPEDLSGARVLDAGCGAGQMTQDLARRGARVVAVDVSPALLDVARERMPESLAGRASFHAGDMLSSEWGRFDHVVAMDSLIYYTAAEVGAALAGLARRTDGRIVFTAAPRTALLMAMWGAGRLFPKSDRSPTMVPQTKPGLARALSRAGCERTLREVARINSGFYISSCLEVAP